MFLYTSFGDHLRWYRMVWQRLVLGYTFKQIGANLGVDTATEQWDSLSPLEASKNGENNLGKKLTSTVELILLTIVIQKPGILLREQLSCSFLSLTVFTTHHAAIMKHFQRSSSQTTINAYRCLSKWRIDNSHGEASHERMIFFCGL